jgi:nitrate/TMAO reductase-like tetraheme cytochrome c subunit
MSHADRGWGSGTLQRLLVEQVYERIKTYVHFKLKTVVRTAAVTIHIDKTL